MSQMPRIYLREAAMADLEFIKQLHFSGLRESGSLSVDESLDADLDDIDKHYTQRGGIFLVATAGGPILGMGALKPLMPGLAEVKRMRVAADARRQGIGQLILTALIRVSRERGATRIVLDTSTKQVAAQGLYAKNGFKEVRRGQISDISSIFYELALEESDERARSL